MYLLPLIGMTQKYIDLHTHTFYSDGILTPTDNVRTARINGIDILAITDHDKTDGYKEAKLAGEKYQVQIIPGTEISTSKYHILGLGIDVYSQKFIDFLEFSADEQKKVCIKRIDGLRAQGVPITLEKVLELFPKSRLGKMNVMYTMMQDRECQGYFMEHDNQKLTKPLYDNYLRDPKGKWVEDKMTTVTSQRAINAIHDAGGIAILAHPPIDVKDMAEMNTLLEEGINGIEVQVRGNGENQKFIDFAIENNLLITYGSDYHGGIFDRDCLNNKGNNILTADLARALGIKYN